MRCLPDLASDSAWLAGPLHVGTVSGRIATPTHGNLYLAASLLIEGRELRRSPWRSPSLYTAVSVTVFQEKLKGSWKHWGISWTLAMQKAKGVP